MESNLCLYNAMRDNCLLDNMTPSEARQYYGARVEIFLKDALKSDSLPPDEKLTGAASMGTISVLQVYLKEHPSMAFFIKYQNPNMRAFFMLGSEIPAQIAAFEHNGSIDGGHFTAIKLDQSTRAELLNQARAQFRKPTTPTIAPEA